MSVIARDAAPIKPVVKPFPPPKSRKPLAAVHGTCRWLITPLAVRDFESGVLAINVEEYVCTFGPDRSGARLTKSTGEVRHVDLLKGQCDCPDHECRPNRPGGCKHLAALRALVSVLPRKQKHAACPSCQAPVDGGQLCDKCRAEEEEFAGHHQADEMEAAGLDPWACPEADDRYGIADEPPQLEEADYFAQDDVA